MVTYQADMHIIAHIFWMECFLNVYLHRILHYVVCDFVSQFRNQMIMIGWNSMANNLPVLQRYIG